MRPVLPLELPLSRLHRLDDYSNLIYHDIGRGFHSQPLVWQGKCKIVFADFDRLYIN